MIAKVSLRIFKEYDRLIVTMCQIFFFFYQPDEFRALAVAAADSNETGSYGKVFYKTLPRLLSINAQDDLELCPFRGVTDTQLTLHVPLDDEL